MQQYSKQVRQHTGTMETETIQKNGTRPKSRISRKFFLISVVLLAVLCLAHTANAQTYQYRYLHTVDEDGVKTKGSGTNVYITFTNSQKNVCYFSDKKGTKSEHEDIYRYVKNQNNTYTYMCDVEAEAKKKYPCTGNHFFDQWGEIKCMNCASVEGYVAGTRFAYGTTKLYLYFSTDFTRMNNPNRGTYYPGTAVYERADASVKDIPLY
jgi:hypothetical protein